MSTDIELTRDVEWFVNRPSTSRICTVCRGTGHETDRYCLVPADPRIEGVPDDVICAVVVGAQSIWNCVREACDIAIRSGRSVAFQFTGEVVVVKPGDDSEIFVRDWWVKKYGETPEETAMRR